MVVTVEAMVDMEEALVVDMEAMEEAMVVDMEEGVVVVVVDVEEVASRKLKPNSTTRTH